MKQGKKQQLATYEKLRETISAKISEVCLPGISSASHSGPTPLPDHGYALPAVQECVVYYLCGYIVHSFLKHVNCAACISSIQSTNTKFPASLLTLAREFRNGSLKHPSTELYTMLKRVEEKLSLVLGENHLCADMFWDALDVIKDCDVPSKTQGLCRHDLGAVSPLHDLGPQPRETRPCSSRRRANVAASTARLAKVAQVLVQSEQGVLVLFGRRISVSAYAPLQYPRGEE
ncbi:hypothetical protein HPB51_013641 [Rhipicephalus microplus]|uniref:Uncharacterized protein n=1 Tax=Rhipicephalus microplus TaxID=6941 RepID=A0A9J6EAP4_RHIMP|nr:hypothetical protein HPB51_013641 [Rhipicephalus microplus]